MKKISEKIVFFGNERLATGVTTEAPTLQALINAGYLVAAVVSNYESAQSRSARALEIESVAKNHNIPVLLPTRPKDIKDQLENYHATLGVLVAYGKIVPQEIIDIFPRGIVNIHPSLLPHYRGPTPIEQAILDGISTTGVSIMRLAKEMDAGPVFAQKRMSLTGNESKQELADTLLRLGSELLISQLPKILDGSATPMPQDDTKATYDKLITKANGNIDWHKPAVQIEREIRAFTEWPKSRARLAGKEVIITKARAVRSEAIGVRSGEKPGTAYVSDDKRLLVASAEGTLIIDRLKPASKNEMSAEGFLAGHKLISN